MKKLDYQRQECGEVKPPKSRLAIYLDLFSAFRLGILISVFFYSWVDHASYAIPLVSVKSYNVGLNVLATAIS